MQAPVPGNISEEYYQISEAILSSFPKYRPPLNIYRFKEEVAQVQLFIRKETRITNEQIEELFTLCREGNIFVSREDFPIYSKHIVKQLDLVLVDTHLKEAEVADITVEALGFKLGAFFEQPVKPVYEDLHEAIQVVTEYIWQDEHRLRLYLRRLFTGEHTLVNHSLNSFAVGLWLLFATQGRDMHRREFDRTAVALLIHDAGMVKVPSFITTKTTSLKPEERDKIIPHPIIGMKIAQKLDIVTPELGGIILEHHERLDGSGYPQKHGGETISRHGRLAAVADSFSAMIQKRPYAAAMKPAEAAAALAAEKTRYDTRFTSPLQTAYLTNNFSFR